MKRFQKQVLGAFILLPVFVIGLYVLCLHKLDFASTPNAFSLFGDYVGGVFGAMTGIVSVVLLYLTYTKQIEIFQKQEKQTVHQQFETDFFHLLDNFRDLLRHMNNKSERTEGLSYIHSIRKLVEADINKVFTPLNALETRRKIDDVYNTAFLAESDQLGHYFRSLYHLLKFVEEHCLNVDERKMYFDLIQAQMNTDELYLTCLNGISRYGRKNMRPLLDKSSFLENLAIDEDENVRKLIYFFYPRTKRKDTNGLRRNVIMIAGTAGTGKGTLSKMLLAEQLPARISSIQGLLLKANKNPNDLLKNHNVLQKMLAATIDPDDVYVMSCSFCQLNEDGSNDILPLSIYDGIRPIAVIFLEASVDEMQQRIRRDDNVFLDETQAELYLQNEETTASDYAAELDIPFIKYRTDDLTLAAGKVRELVCEECRES